MSVGRSALAKFIRYSVVDQVVEGQAPKIARFRWQIDELEADSYHKDLVARLRKFFGELEEAVNTERNGTFEARVSAYNALAKAIEVVKAEQSRRDRVREVRAKAGFDKPKPVRQPRVTKIDDSPEAIATRKASADSLRDLI
jgi:deoxyribodipyrimidine photolyase-like uncharacterized protein